MNEAEFDKFADEYLAMHTASIKMSGEGPDYFAKYKIIDLQAEYRQRSQPSAAPSILDFGAGSGTSIAHMKAHFPTSSLTCADVSERSLALAKSRFPTEAEYVRLGDGALPFADNHFDIIFAACVFHHIDHDEHRKILSEWFRVLRPGGLALIYEHNPYNPLTRKVVNSCEFDVNARLITAGQMRDRFEAGGFRNPDVRYRLFFPKALSALRPLESRLAWLPMGAQYYVAASK